MGLSESLDAAISGFLSQWDIYSTTLATLLVVAVSYGIMTTREPDIHPMLLAKQAVPTSVRNEGESAVYRSHGAPHSMPLKSGLDVKDADSPRWAPGRTGDLRDVWRRVVTGDEKGAKGSIMTVWGTATVVDHPLAEITRQINLIGQHIAQQGGIKVAIYLPNSVELLITLLACSFYPNLTAVLVPFDVSEDELVSMLRRSAADTVVTAPGSFPFDAVVKAYPSLRQLIWVVDEGSSHMDWDEVPEGVGGSVNVATWQDIIRDAPAGAGSELPASDAKTAPQDVVTFWRGKAGAMEEMVRFSQSNLAAGIAGQIFALPVKERLSPADLFLPADALSNIHTLTVTLMALFSNSSVAFNSAAGSSTDLQLATQGIAPTVVVASPETLRKSHEESMGKLTSILGKLSHRLSTRALVEDGVHLVSNMLSPFASASRPLLGNKPGKLRLVYVAERAGANTAPVLSSQVLSDLRIFTGARVVYALAAPRVAGAVTQTGYYDYRVLDGRRGHFGVPLTCTEVYMKDMGAYKTGDGDIQGEICVRGPCVAGGNYGLGVAGQLGRDNTLSYV